MGYVIIEAGNCARCGKRIGNSGYVFLCEECARKEEKKRRCLHEKPKEGATGMVKPGRFIMAREPKQKPTNREEQ